MSRFHCEVTAAMMGVSCASVRGLPPLHTCLLHSSLGRATGKYQDIIPWGGPQPRRTGIRDKCRSLLTFRGTILRHTLQLFKGLGAEPKFPTLVISSSSHHFLAFPPALSPSCSSLTPASWHHVLINDSPPRPYLWLYWEKPQTKHTSW